MNKAWAIILVLAIVLMLVVTGYEFINSLSGANVTFSKTVSPLSIELHTEKLDTFSINSDYQLVKDKDLDNK